MTLRVWLTLALWLSAWTLSTAAPDYRRADNHALRASPETELFLDRLARYLCPSHFTEEEKARAIYRWIADRIRYDVEGLRTNQLTAESQSAGVVLRQRKAVCAGYSKLFVALAKRGGLQAYYLSGDSDFNDFPFPLDKRFSGHAWNGVYLNGRWRLLDVTWGAGEMNEQGAFQKGFDDYWFCTPADQFIYSHFPAEANWQLLPSAWSKQRWDAQPRLAASFFRYGLTWSGGKMPLRPNGEELVLRWPARRDVMAYSVLFDSQGKKLPGWSFAQSSAHQIETRTRFFKPGRYTLKVYCRERTAARTMGSLTFWRVAKLPVEVTRKTKMSLYPEVADAFWPNRVELLEPLSRELVGGSRYRFRIRAPEAVEISVYHGEKRLRTLPLSWGVAEGEVVVPARGSLYVYARYPGKFRYHGLLVYTVAQGGKSSRSENRPSGSASGRFSSTDANRQKPARRMSGS